MIYLVERLSLLQVRRPSTVRLETVGALEVQAILHLSHDGFRSCILTPSLAEKLSKDLRVPVSCSPVTWAFVPGDTAILWNEPGEFIRAEVLY